MKNWKLLVWAMALMLILSACQKGKSLKDTNTPADTKQEQTQKIDHQFKGKTLHVLSVTPDLRFAANSFEQKYGCKVEFQLLEETDWKNIAAIRQHPHDVVTIEADDMRFWLSAEVLLPLTEVSEEQYVPYTTAFAKDEAGNLRALTWSVNPVSIYYRRSIAKEILGNDQPETVLKAMETYAAMDDTSHILLAAGHKAFANLEDMGVYYPEVQKMDYLKLTDAEKDFLTKTKNMETEYRLAGLSKWSPNWFRGMYGKAMNPITGNPISVFAYALPSWAKPFLLEKAGEEVPGQEEKNPTWGDWGMIPAPKPTFEAGIWLGINQDTKEPDLAKEFLMYVTQNKEFLEQWLPQTYEIPAFLPVLEEYRAGEGDSFLGGQVLMPMYREIAKEIPAKSARKLAEEAEYYRQLEKFLKGEIQTLEELELSLIPDKK